MAHDQHILICGERGVGKSTLISHLLETNALPVYGFITKKLPADETGFHPIYIHPAGQSVAAREWTNDNLIGTCDSKIHNIRLETFNTLGVQYLSQAQPGGVVVMDELGFMESQADAFVKAVFAALDGDIPVIAAVKARFDVPFLNQVRAHPNATVYSITAENRDALTETLTARILNWNQMT